MKNLFLFFLLSLSAFGETTYPMKELSALYKEAKSNRHKADANREIIRKGLENRLQLSGCPEESANVDILWRRILFPAAERLYRLEKTESE